jgi:hypothetical protein
MSFDNDNSNNRERSRSRSRERGNNRSEYDDDRAAAADDQQPPNDFKESGQKSEGSQQNEGFNLYITNLSFQVPLQCLNQPNNRYK